MISPPTHGYTHTHRYTHTERHTHTQWFYLYGQLTSLDNRSIYLLPLLIAAEDKLRLNNRKMDSLTVTVASK